MKGIKEYLQRVGKSRGFSIQSPWAFRFVTEVIGERLPYYAYEEIDKRYKGRQERKFQKLLLRLRNDVYPHKVIVVDDILLLTDEYLSDVVLKCGTAGAFVVRYIYKDDERKHRWEALKANDKVGVTFDLYRFAICFLDLKMYKQHYKLNF